MLWPDWSVPATNFATPTTPLAVNHISSLIIYTHCYFTGRHTEQIGLTLHPDTTRAYVRPTGPQRCSIPTDYLESYKTERIQTQESNPKEPRIQNATNETRNLPPNQPPRPRIRPTQQPHPLKPPLHNLLPPRPLRGHSRPPILHRLRILLPRHDHRLRILPRPLALSIWWKGCWVVLPGCWGRGD